jgi:TonB family protein
MKSLALAVFLAFCADSAFADDFKLYGQLDHVLLSAPNLDYPSEGIRKKITGGGVYRMNVNAAGIVTATQVVQSTGSQVLDRAALGSLKRWRFKPGSVVGWARTPCLWSLPGYYSAPDRRKSPIIAVP